MSQKKFKILFKFPSRERPEKFFETLENIYANLYDKENFGILSTFDSNDINGMAHDDNYNKLFNKYKNHQFVYGESKSKIDAFNRDFDKLDIYYPSIIDFDILVAISDDIRFTVFGFDEMIRVEMQNNFPELDGLLHFNDQDAKEQLAILYVAGRKWFEFRESKIYSPLYKSYFCDNEEMDIAKHFNKYHYCGYQILDHLCPGWGRAPKDALYLSQDNHWQDDSATYYSRKQNNFYL